MRSQLGTTVGAFTTQTLTALQQALLGMSAGIFTTGNIYVADAINGSDASGDGTFQKPFATVDQAYAQCVSGNNDVVLLVGNGLTTATWRRSATFTWAKNATHLIGICAPGIYSQRARIAPTGATTAFANFFTVSGSGCVFQNIQWFHGFNTGTTAAICMTVTGSRNVFQRCAIDGMGDAASAQDAGSRSLKIGGSGAGENLFEDCSIGIDTIARTAANASVEFTGDTVRNVFRRCEFPFYGSSASVLGILGTGAACCDRHQTFEDCLFSNAIKSSSTQMTALLSFTSAAPGGLVIFKRCIMVGITKFGDTNGLANSYIDMAAVSAAAGGLGINPS
jgi:hypothetical protein